MNKCDNDKKSVKKGVIRIKKNKPAIISRIALLAFLFFVNISVIAVILTFLRDKSGLFYYMPYIMTVLSAVGALVVICDSSIDEYKIMWLFLLLVLSPIGVILYALVMIGKLTSGKAKRKKKNAGELYEYSGEFEWYPSTSMAFASLMSELLNAKSHIFIECFLISPGYMWESILSVLCEKAREGIAVEIIYDDVGSLFSFSPGERLLLAERGIKCRAFSKIHPILFASVFGRDHRKLIVIDGKTAFVGGMNLSDKYINCGRSGVFWKDSAVKICGAAAMAFLENSSRFTQPENRLCDGTARVLPFMSVPDKKGALPVGIFESLSQKCGSYMWIMTPYLVVPNRLSDILISLAARGIDVRIITPGKGDRFFVHALTRSNYRRLLENKIRIFEYTKGFIHSKVVLVDGDAVAIGSVNFDFRSFYYAYECGAVIYSDGLLKVKEDFLKTLESSREITLDSEYMSVKEKTVAVLIKPFEPLM